MSALVSWLRAHPRLRPPLLLVILTAAVAVGLRLLIPDSATAPRLAPGAVVPGRQAGVASAATTSASASASSDAASVAQASATARGFLVAYATSDPGDSPEALRSRLRPYDTDRLDQALAQGGGAGSAGGQQTTGAVRQLSSVGLAADGRLVMVALVSQTTGAGKGTGTQARYVELFLAREAAGWRVDQVAS